MNNEPEAIIVTIVSTNDKISLDMELPASLPISKIKQQILEVLRNIYAGVFVGWNDCKLVYSNRFLDDGESLNSSGVCEGSYLYVVKI